MSFNYTADRFADIQMLRYRLDGFESLTLRQKRYIHCLSEATLWGRDITFDQFGRYNLKIRRTLEAILTSADADRQADDFLAMEEYLKRVWFSSGIHHHYGCEKFSPKFSEEWFRETLMRLPAKSLPLSDGETAAALCEELVPVIFNPEILPKRVNKADGEDLVLTSACNYYSGVTQQEAEDYYAAKKQAYIDDGHADAELPSFGLNSRLVKDAEGNVVEEIWHEDGKYGAIIKKIVYWLERACEFVENDEQLNVIRLLIDYYRTGDLETFDDYSIAWTRATDGYVDFINGFIETYGDPLGLKASWEGIVEYRDVEATRRTETISSNAQWFEDHSPIDPRFRKPQVKGVTATVIRAAMLGGDEYPSTAIGINLPNADWIRAAHGSKSVTISNITDAYNKAAMGSGFREEFVIDGDTLDFLKRYDDACDNLHTDLHECLGHGSGQLLPGVSPDALKAYGSTIEEARADLFGLYYMADPKLIELGLLPDGEAYKAQYYSYMMNGLLTQLVRITPGNQIEEAHMRNRALIARWCLDNQDMTAPVKAVELVKKDGKTYVRINDYPALRSLFARLLAEIQRVKSEGDVDAARSLVERYAVNIDAGLHNEILERYRRLDLAPYKGFINPVLREVKDADGAIIDISVDYSEGYAEQMLRYSREYSLSEERRVKSEKSNSLEKGQSEVENSSLFTLHSSLKEIKRSFRLMMNGVTSQSMREKGSDYHINWGASLPMLKAKAKEIGKNYELAIALWKENVRECKILATMVMPAERMLPEVVDIWMEQTTTQEIAELASFNLYQHLPFAADKAFRWIASDKDQYQLCGFHILSRLFMQGKEPDDSEINEYIDQLIAALQGSSLPVRKAAMASALHFGDLGEEYERIINRVINN